MANNAVPFTNWDSNIYHINQPAYTSPFSEKTFAAWKADFKIDSNSSFENRVPTQNFVFTRRNKYQPNSFYITIMNYQQLDSVAINEDFSAFQGMTYSLFDVQRSVHIPLLTEKYTGQLLKLPLALTQVAPAVGITPMAPKHTSKTMGTFIVTFYPNEKTIKSGNWNDPSVWDNGRVPTHFDDVELQHPLTVEGLAWCRSLKTNDQLVIIKTGAHLLISNTGN